MLAISIYKSLTEAFNFLYELTFQITMMLDLKKQIEF